MNWQIGDYAICMDSYGWPQCFVQIEAIAPEPPSPAEKYYSVVAITPVIDWTSHYPPIAVVRQPGETFNAHYRELRACRPAPADAPYDRMNLFAVDCQGDEHTWPDEPLRDGLTCLCGTLVARQGRSVVLSDEPAPRPGFDEWKAANGW
jgi:hypothetical protein